jgi:hypothetical protein
MRRSTQASPKFGPTKDQRSQERRRSRKHASLSSSARPQTLGHDLSSRYGRAPVQSTGFARSHRKICRLADRFYRVRGIAKRRQAADLQAMEGPCGIVGVRGCLRFSAWAARPRPRVPSAGAAAPKGLARPCWKPQFSPWLTYAAAVALPNCSPFPGRRVVENLASGGLSPDSRLRR